MTLRLVLGTLGQLSTPQSPLRPCLLPSNFGMCESWEDSRTNIQEEEKAIPVFLPGGGDRLETVRWQCVVGSPSSPGGHDQLAGLYQLPDAGERPQTSRDLAMSLDRAPSSSLAQVGTLSQEMVRMEGRREGRLVAVGEGAFPKPGLLDSLVSESGNLN